MSFIVLDGYTRNFEFCNDIKVIFKVYKDVYEILPIVNIKKKNKSKEIKQQNNSVQILKWITPRFRAYIGHLLI